MSRINTVPRGLQSFLGNTNMGDNPSELSGVAAPVVDLGLFLAVDRIRSYTSAGTVTGGAATGTIVELTVPDNKLFMLLGVGMLADRTAGTGGGGFKTYCALSLFPSLGLGSPGGKTIIGADGSGETSSINREVAWSQPFTQPIPVPAGAIVGWYWSDNTDIANDTYSAQGTMIYYELDI